MSKKFVAQDFRNSLGAKANPRLNPVSSARSEMHVRSLSAMAWSGVYARMAIVARKTDVEACDDKAIVPRVLR